MRQQCLLFAPTALRIKAWGRPTKEVYPRSGGPTKSHCGRRVRKADREGERRSSGDSRASRKGDSFAARHKTRSRKKRALHYLSLRRDLSRARRADLRSDSFSGVGFANPGL